MSVYSRVRGPLSQNTLEKHVLLLLIKRVRTLLLSVRSLPVTTLKQTSLKFYTFYLSTDPS